MANYRWFKDGKKRIENKAPLEFRIESVGYEEDKQGNLIIASDEEIRCVTKMRVNDIVELIKKLNAKYSSGI